VVYFRESANRRQVFRGALQHQLEFVLRFVELAHFQESPTERHAGGQVAGVQRQPSPARLDRFLRLSGPAVLFRQLGKRNRRRIPLDPASKVFNSMVVAHSNYGTVTVAVTVPVRGGTKLSVTVNVTV